MRKEVAFASVCHPRQHSHTHTLSLTYTHIHTHSLSLAHTHTHSLSITYTHTHTHSHTHYLSLTYTHTHKQSLTHTYTHTHTQRILSLVTEVELMGLRVRTVLATPNTLKYIISKLTKEETTLTLFSPRSISNNKNIS